MIKSNLNKVPLKNLKSLCTELDVRPRRELKYKERTEKSQKGGSCDSRKETINLMINNPNTGLAILMKEAPGF